MSDSATPYSLPGPSVHGDSPGKNARVGCLALLQGIFPYDNMSGSVGILGIAEHFAKNPHRYGLRFIWCGSEERGLLGSKAS